MKKQEIDSLIAQEATRLMAAWKDYKDRHPGATQTWLGAATTLGTQGAVGQYLRGVIPLNLRALLLICGVLEIEPRKISPRLADLGDMLHPNERTTNENSKVSPSPYNSDINIILELLAHTDREGCILAKNAVIDALAQYKMRQSQLNFITGDAEITLEAAPSPVKKSSSFG